MLGPVNIDTRLIKENYLFDDYYSTGVLFILLLEMAILLILDMSLLQIHKLQIINWII